MPEIYEVAYASFSLQELDGIKLSGKCQSKERNPKKTPKDDKSSYAHDYAME